MKTILLLVFAGTLAISPSAIAQRPDGPPDDGPGRERGPGRMGGGSSIKGVELDPLAGSTDDNKPLLRRLLAVPSLKARYLANVRTLAETWLDWEKLGPLAGNIRHSSAMK